MPAWLILTLAALAWVLIFLFAISMGVCAKRADQRKGRSDA